MVITQNGVLKRDDNDQPVMGGTSSSDNATIINAAFDPITRRLLTDASGGGSGTVTSISGGTGILLTPDPITTTGSVALVARIAPIATLGTANQQIRVNAGATALEYFTPSAGSDNITIGTTTITSGTTTRILYDNAGVVGEYTITGTGTVVAMATNPTLSGITMADATNIVINTSTGTKIGTGTTQKIGFFNATPIVQPSGDVVTALQNLGLVASATITGATASLITVANEATDTSCFPVFVTAATGDLGPKSNAGLTFNSNTALLTATLLAGTTSVTSASILASSNDSGAIGASGTAFADLFLASGGVINWAANNSNITHSTGVLTVGAGEFRITSANVGTNADSVPTLSSTSTLTNKTLTSPTIQTAPVFAAGTNIKLTVPSSDVTGTGIITNEFNSGYSSTAIGDLVYLDSSATWQKADADASAATYSSMLGIALSVTASASPATVLLQGFVYAASPFPTFTIGAPVYMSATAGAVTQTAPTTTDSATRIVGYGVHADKMWFNPSNDWITHT